MSTEAAPRTRRRLLQDAHAGGVALGAGGLLAACGGGSNAAPGETTTGSATLRRGGALRLGVVGSGGKDTLDPHVSTFDADHARVFNLYDRLVERAPDFKLQMGLAESIEPNERADVWTIRLRSDVTWHDGKPLTADDVVFTLKRILDPKDPKVGASQLSYVEHRRIRKVDPRTLQVPLKAPNVGFPDDLDGYWMGVVPEGFDPRAPVGTGPFKSASFTAGSRSVFVRNDGYSRSGEPRVDRLEIVDLNDDTARVNRAAQRPGRRDQQPPGVADPGGRGRPPIPCHQRRDRDLEAVPHAARLRALPGRARAPGDAPDRRPRAAGAAGALGGHGRVANDLFATDDACYPSDLGQRRQDLDQARSLLRQAGQSDLRVEMVTAPVYTGLVEAAQVLAEQAKGAGVTVNVRKVDSATLYGENYLNWRFSMDDWFPRPFLTQAALSNMPGAPWNHTHFREPEFVSLVSQARRALDEGKRCELIGEAQRFLWERGGYVIWGLANQVDAYSARFGGFAPSRSGYPLGRYTIRSVGALA